MFSKRVRSSSSRMRSSSKPTSKTSESALLLTSPSSASEAGFFFFFWAAVVGFLAARLGRLAREGCSASESESSPLLGFGLFLVFTFRLRGLLTSDFFSASLSVAETNLGLEDDDDENDLDRERLVGDPL